MAAKLNASWAGSTEGAPGLAPEGNAAAWLQADGAAARLVQCVALEDDVAVGVGHQQVQAKVEASPAPAVLQDTGDTEGTQPEDGLCHASSEGSVLAVGFCATLGGFRDPCQHLSGTENPVGTA